jgi:MoaA/NifB/PqqE/SkfB family radical SAM enzyme
VTSSFSSLVRTTWQKNILFAAHFELTYACNLDCTFCYNDRARAERERALTDDEWCGLLDELSAMNVLTLVLSGGEPLVHPGFFRIAAHARARGFVIRIKTNGHTLRGAILDRVIDEVAPYTVEVSLHGATAATHDRQTQVPGSFARLVDNVRAAKDRVRIQMNTPLTSWNEHEVADMIALTRTLGVRHRIDPDITVKDDGDRTPLALAPTREGLAAWLRAAAADRAASTPTKATAVNAASPQDLVPEAPAEMPCGAHGEEGDKHCGAGSASILVDPFGDVLPCVQWRKVIGNVRTTPIRALWSGGGFDSVRASLVDVKRALGDEADHCPGVAAELTGSLTGRTPQAALRSDVRKNGLPILR